MPQRRVSIVLPALNEERTIGEVIDEIKRADVAARGYEIEVLVVDNGRTDRTEDIASRQGARVIREGERGKGSAVRTGFGQVSGDFVFMLDADFTYPAAHIPEMLELLEDGHDVVLGSRIRGYMEPGAMSRLNVVGNRLLALLANLLYGTRISDLCTGCWGFRREVIDGLELDARGFDLEAEMFAEVARKGYRVVEVPIGYRRRKTPSKLGSIRDGVKIGRTLIKERWS